MVATLSGKAGGNIEVLCRKGGRGGVWLNTGQSHAIEEGANNPDGGYPALAMGIEIPEELKGVGEAVQTMGRQVEAT